MTLTREDERAPAPSILPWYFLLVVMRGAAAMRRAGFGNRCSIKIWFKL